MLLDVDNTIRFEQRDRRLRNTVGAQRMHEILMSVELRLPRLGCAKCARLIKAMVFVLANPLISDDAHSEPCSP